ncbi:hypothetical protein ACIBO5_48690 [Nonomuraea angiospora]|uniref:hypothetical protein n=1 Tax=Nonomuraea angiospora TaxID=46172 RepID=UPI0037A7596F
MADEDDKSKRRSELAVQAVVAMGLSAMTQLAGPEAALFVAPLAASASPMTSHALNSALDKARRRRSIQAESALAQAASELHMDELELVERLSSDPARITLLATALEGASKSVWQDKISVFAQVIKNGLLYDDDAKIDMEIAFGQIFADIELPHIKILMFLQDDPETPGNLRIARTAELPVEGVACNYFLSTLVRHGLLREITASEIGEWGNARHVIARAGLSGGNPAHKKAWMITPLGRACLARVTNDYGPT